ncbi:5-keto-L-gluconate epimerase [Candidatus Hakubella thermalkaliphila]|uniref:5-keto-L-gluconate epimerase n=4 Tax=Candidatus Hakubella thermalkaliphila TaxID=2754717 RepID=A0A6V8NE63_9ACTN|nr:5-keto-L-gluconate epimerase [Candidatus Hakubella thermalkaliphila]GFP18535.1 5-keto-L-gluconate epimerase [Candidatus Hakubella thermalkaliphila]GFP23020.1 5-keto-L-gluconate epimerase [Candidatus Hakubella thermalkaliphila]GFP37424.1 5-keto-L-gluconate epimerase [Candidatus Hakubella thermalkaliphila]
MELAFVISLQETSFSAISQGQDLKKSLSRLRELGYQGVELAVRDPETVDVELVKEVVQSYNLEVPAIGTGQAYLEEGLSLSSPDPDVRQKTRERLKKHVQFASIFRAGVIIGLIRGGYIVEGVDFSKGRKWVVKGIRECCQAAQEKGIQVYLEPLNRYEINFINTLHEGADLIAEVGEKNLYLLADTFHMNIEEPSIIQSLESMADLIGHVHVADSNRWAPGCGHLDFASIVGTLERISYKGFLSAEILPRPSFQKAAELTVTFFQNFHFISH